MYCPNCGKELPDDAEFCSNCGNNVKFSPRSVQYTLSLKNGGIAAVLSFLMTGLGQIYAGKISRGLFILLGGIAIGSLTIFSVYTGLDIDYDTGDVIGYSEAMVWAVMILGIIGVIYWIWQIYDAYKIAQQYNEAVQTTGQKPW